MAYDHAERFAELYERHHRRLLALAIHAFGPADAEDLAQEAMTRAYASYARLDPTRDPWPWLVAILRNVARDRHAARDPVPLASVPGGDADGTAEIEERAVVSAALRRLSSSDREALVLRECHELSFHELSALLGRSPNTLRQQVFRARRRLADAYTALGGRAVALACLARRWRLALPDAATQAVAAAAVGLALANGAAAPQAQPPPARGVAAGPVARGGAPARPAAGRAAPARPLQPSRAARSVAPRAVAPGPGESRVASPSPPPLDPRPRAQRVDAGPVHDAYVAERSAGAMALCALAGAAC